MNRRIVSWFSCGAASAVATKKALEKHGHENFVIASCVLENEHEDNKRFLKDCEKWFDHPILLLRNEKYKDLWDLWEKKKWIGSSVGAPCTFEFKKKVRQKFQKVTDVQVFGFTFDEIKRADKFKESNPEVDLYTPLIQNEITKNDCYKIIQQAGIELPMMYRLGYNNNNCIGCVKGGAGYWNKIRKDFPDVFKRMSEVERKIDSCMLRVKGKRVFLDELDPNAGRKQKEPTIECGLWCKED